MRGVVSLVLLTALAPGPAQAVPPQNARLGEAALLASVCSGCHASDGSSTAIKPLGGRSAADLSRDLLRYKNAADGASAMHRMARGYSDEQLEMIANHIAGR